MPLTTFKPQEFMAALEKDKSKNYYVYCRWHNSQACQIMDQMGFENT
jgi:rhodanese-related sulfurtransferase